MTNTKSTKRALLVSVMAMVICFTMLLGTTFAWFTDSTESTGNKIVAGTLDVQLWMHNGTDYVDISGTTKSIFGEGSIAQDNNLQTLWEPGKTQVAYLAVKNVGNLDLRFTVDLLATNATNELNNVILYAVVPNATPADPVTGWTTGNSVAVASQKLVPNTILAEEDGNDVYYFALVLHMAETAGNAYMGGTIDFDVKVLATQADTESDEWSTDYDNSQNP